jgi:hypothetical protein
MGAFYEQIKGLRLTAAPAHRKMERVQLSNEVANPLRFPADPIGEEAIMFAYVLVLLGVLSRYLVASHAPWLNFTAEGASLLYFGARRSKREMIFPLAAYMLSDYCLTTYVYHYPFHWQQYLFDWSWYIMAMALGWVLLHAKTTFVRGAAAALLGPTSFWIVIDFGVWAGGNMYPHTLSGLITCYVAAIPFYRNDLLSASLILAAAFAIEAALRRVREPQAGVALAGK